MTERRSADEDSRWLSPWAAMHRAPQPTGQGQAFVAIWGLLVLVHITVPAVSTIAMLPGLTLIAIGVLGTGFAELLDPALRPFAIGVRWVGLITVLFGGVVLWI